MLNLNQVPNEWTERLASAMGGAIRQFAISIKDELISMLAIDCHPWHGLINLAILTSEEAASDSRLANPNEMAAWRHFNFASSYVCWQDTMTLGQEMKRAYEAGDKQDVAEAFLRACSRAVSSKEVCMTVALLNRANDFRCSVVHPDDGREFVV